MAYNRSTSKGFGFERELAVAWSKWFTNGDREDVFWRTSGSGGRATRNTQLTRYTHGDMAPIDPIGYPLCDRFNFEFKFYKDYTLLGVLHPVGPDRDWVQFWTKTCWEAEQSSRYPLLVTKRNHGKPCIWLPHCIFRDLVMSKRAIGTVTLTLAEEPVVLHERHSRKPGGILVPLRDQEWHIVSGIQLQEFFVIVDPDSLIELVHPRIA
jgi:hypothetical protein